MRGDPRARAMAAIGHRQFAQLAALIPKEDWNNPKLLLSWFVTAADFDRRGADTPAFREAHAALHELITVEGLRDRAAALYHDPRIQNLAGDKLAWYLDHPAVAMEELSRLERLGQVPSQLAHDVRLVFEESREMGVLTEGPIAPSAPPVGAAAEAERARLLDKSVTGRLSASEEARLTQLYEAKIASDDRAGAGQAEEELAAHRRALGGAAEPRGARKPRGGEYERLIAASVSGGATAADEARLVELAGERAVAEGQITNDQLERDNG